MKKNLYLFLMALLVGSHAFGQYHVATMGTKNVLLEEATGAWGGYNPDSYQDIMEKVLPLYPNTIIASWHNGDPMQLTGDPFCTGTGYIYAYPTATIDRALFDTNVAVMRPFDSFVNIRNILAPNFDVDMFSTYNTTTRQLLVTVKGTALASLTGNWNLNAYLIEDSISSGTASTYNQHNYAGTSFTTSCTGSPSWYLSAGNPIMPTSLYPHNNVVRNILCPSGSIWGQPAFTNPTTGVAVSQTYTFTIPPSYNPAYLKVVGFVQKFGSTTHDRAIENAVSTQVRLMPPGHLTATADSFNVYTGNTCSGTQYFITTPLYRSGCTVFTSFGDGATSTNGILLGGVGGYADFSHAYSSPGTYTVQHILLEGGVAVDSVSYSNDYFLCNQFPVNFYFDANANCVFDTTEDLNYLPDLTEVDSNGVPVDTISATSGFYYTAYGVPGDVYTFRPINVPAGLYVNCPSTGVITDTIGTTVYTSATKYFGLTCLSTSSFDLALHATTRAGRHTNSGIINVINNFCTPTDATVTMDHSPVYNFSSSSPSPTSVVGNRVTWVLHGVTAAYPLSGLIEYRLEVPGTWLTPGDTVQTRFHVDPTTGDADTTNNDWFEIDTVRASYDPNEMDVKPGGYISAGTKLLYSITFENTGNDTAKNIYVMDTLSDNVDINSLKLISSTNAMKISTMKAGGHNIVKFDFPNINLLDSSHHNLCDGNVMFNINAKTGLPNGTLIFNHAGIFFDDNPVVMTNTVKNTIGIPNAVPSVLKAANAEVFPNPATDLLTLRTDAGKYNTYTIANAMGQEMMTSSITMALTSININALPTGVYSITLTGNSDTKVLKFVKK